MLSVIISIYNSENILEENIKKLIKFLNTKNIRNYELMIVNDGSKDKSLLIIQKLLSNKIKYIGYNKNKGRGYAIKYASNLLRGEKIIMMDLDLPSQLNLNVLKEIIKDLNKYDLVIGSRYLEESKIKREPLRAFFSKIYRLLIKIFFLKLKIKDTDMGLKGFKKNILIDLNKQSKENRWSWDLELLVNARKKNYTVKEVPVIWKEDKKSTLNPIKGSLEQFRGILSIKLRSLLK